MQWIEAAEMKCTPALFLCKGVCFDISPTTRNVDTIYHMGTLCVSCQSLDEMIMPDYRCIRTFWGKGGSTPPSSLGLRLNMAQTKKTLVQPIQGTLIS